MRFSDMVTVNFIPTDAPCPVCKRRDLSVDRRRNLEAHVKPTPLRDGTYPECRASGLRMPRRTKATKTPRPT